MRMLSDFEERIRNRCAANIVRWNKNPDESVSDDVASLEAFVWLMLTLKKYPVSSSVQDDSEEEIAKP
jgi:hypothetical protein